MSPHSPEIPVGGRLRFFVNRWRRITSDSSILDIVSGMHIELTDLPRQNSIPQPLSLSPDEIKAGSEHIKILLEKKAIVLAPQFEKNQFVSNVFLIPKRDSGFRMILNLKKFNFWVTFYSFKMETLNHILSYITPNCFMAIFDFCDAYLTVPIAGHHVRFLKFIWQGKMYMYVVFYPSESVPRPENSLNFLSQFWLFLRKQGIIVLTYIDDGFTVAPTFQACFDNIVKIMRTFSFYGFIIHKIKSHPFPSQQVRSLGFHLNSVSMTITLPSDKTENAINLCVSALQQRNCIQAVFLAKVIGTLVSIFPACPLGKLHYRSLEMDKVAILRKIRGNYEAFGFLSDESCKDLIWWKDSVPFTAAPIKRNNPTDIVFTDSSDYAWCGFYDDSTANGFFTSDEFHNIIAFKELLAIFYALRSFVKFFKGNHILIRSDSVSAVAYVRDMGGMHNSLMNKLAKDIWDFAVKNNFWISISYVPSSENDADFGSRHLSTRTEWTLPVPVFQKLVHRTFLPSIDLFASRLNAKLERYVSWFPDPYSVDVDSLLRDWHDDIPFLFPPFSLLSRCLQKLVADSVTKALIVFPLWPTQHWFPRLLHMVTSTIYLLPDKPAIFLPWETTITQHPLQSVLLLSAAEITPALLNSPPSHLILEESFSMESGQVPRGFTRQLIGNGMHLQVQNRSIHICPLWKMLLNFYTGGLKMPQSHQLED